MSTRKTRLTSAQLEEESVRLRREYEQQQKDYKKRIREAKAEEEREAKAKRDAELIQLGLEFEQLKKDGNAAAVVDGGITADEYARMKTQYDAMKTFLMRERTRKDGVKFQYWSTFTSEHPGVF